MTSSSSSTTTSDNPAGVSRKRRHSGDGRGGDGGREGDKSKQRKVWTFAQEQLLTRAVETIGAGKWKQMVSDFDFGDKASNMLKDKWRRMCQKKEKMGEEK